MIHRSLAAANDADPTTCAARAPRSCATAGAGAKSTARPRRLAGVDVFLLPRNHMPKGYWIARVDIADAEAYKAYVAANAAPIARFGGRFVVRAGRYENPEGSSRSRNIVLEFPSYQAALDCWHSPDYQAAVKLRLPVSTVDMVVVEGYDGPQPG
jgi:uncharacterized protein (DUF1330 family)